MEHNHTYKSNKQEMGPSFKNVTGTSIILEVDNKGQTHFWHYGV